MPCPNFDCLKKRVTGGSIYLSAEDVTPASDGMRRASNSRSPGPALYRWRLASPCQIRDETVGACTPADFVDCPDVPDRVVVYYVVQRQRLAQADGTPVDGTLPPDGGAPGTPYGPWIGDGQGCIDVTDLNPPPSPDEVFRYFQELPLPELTAQQQPPGNALVGLPVIFYTTDPATQTYTVDIRGFTVTILATARTYTWHTGDGTDLTSTDPGAPYPDQTVTHDYRAGTYTASLTTTWGGTYTVDAGAPADVPGTTTTDGPPTTFTVLQARAVLTDPYD
ncbi:hypothetical protein GB931_00640 [Modestobacter sp. I12A-02628]|uniref:PKD domain-containing protein n=1 Tax=Goekera deserti TaxID=2497753 RepID=A0A7K3WG82_9ACTN|nr:PKD domain-containing protein [Goekera deserti]MPQ96452.1 hypothetical protein [Goekera deserti]NDI47233.1 hypothetical protein [Goekera deserti]NEL55366.1 hypothetical protein [Goekera deserti]